MRKKAAYGWLRQIRVYWRPFAVFPFGCGSAALGNGVSTASSAFQNPQFWNEGEEMTW
jgi:hypothetical protein